MRQEISRVPQAVYPVSILLLMSAFGAGVEVRPGTLGEKRFREIARGLAEVLEMFAWRVAGKKIAPNAEMRRAIRLLEAYAKDLVTPSEGYTAYTCLRTLGLVSQDLNDWATCGPEAGVNITSETVEFLALLHERIRRRGPTTN